MNTDQSLALEFSSIDDLVKHGFKNLVESIKHSNQLPSGTNYDFYQTNESFNKLLMEDGGRILRLMNHILNSQENPVSVFNRTNDERVELLVDANDEILEGVDDMIDEYNGLKKKPQKLVEIETVSARLPVNGSWNQINKAKIDVTSSFGIPQDLQLQNSYKTINLISAKNILRPQKFFKDKIDNSNLYPWQPRITHKPNSLKQLSLYVEETEFGSVYSHPYEIELERFKPLPETLTKCTPVKYDGLDNTALIEVNTEESLTSMLNQLREVKEIAVDLEHHSYRTFLGITCLMQISIKGKDFLVDTLALRDKLWVLNEVFTKESIVKIFHGADSDVIWLQRDLSLYLVNLFDTHQAAILLDYPRRSLSCLITKFCNFVPNKYFQLADWRIRPLPVELKKYAREDTHYLIYIYHMMRNELLDKGKGEDNLLQAVFERSREICIKRFIKPICTEDSYMKFYRNCKRFFDNRQLFALKTLYNWRDNIAREEDESTGYVLPNHMMLQICESLPREMQGIFACCNPVPPLLRANALEIHNIILKARDQPLEKAILKEDNRAKGSTLQFNRINMDGPLNCPHDIIKAAEFCSDLPTLLTNSNTISLQAKLIDLNIQKQHSIYSVFDTNENIYDKNKANVLNNLSFLGPYERYKLVKPFVQAEEDKEQEKQRKQQEIVDKSSDPPIAERIIMLRKDCATISASQNEDVTPNLVTNKEKNTKKVEKLVQSIRQQYPNTKRKRRSSIEIEKTDNNQNNQELTSTIPNFKPGTSRKRQRNSQGTDGGYKNKKQRRGDPQNSQNPPQIQQNTTPPPTNDQNRGNKRRNRLRNRCGQNMQNKQLNLDEIAGSFEPEPFKPFDYGTIDFMRFGGASNQGTSKQNKVNSQFRGRGQGKRNFRGKNTNKAAPFFKNDRK